MKRIAAAILMVLAVSGGACASGTKEMCADIAQRHKTAVEQYLAVIRALPTEDVPTEEAMDLARYNGIASTCRQLLEMHCGLPPVKEPPKNLYIPEFDK